MTAAALPDREALWESLRQRNPDRWDLVVIGGGITGVGVLREAARRGYRCLLLEQKDYGWGTSSRSSKLVHGGLRYLASGQIGLTRHALRERERLLSEAPWLVQRLPFYYPLYRGEFPPRLLAGLLFWLYDRLAGVDDHRRLDSSDLKQLFPGLDPSGISAVYRYGDAVTDDARLVLRLLLEAARDGATMRNYSRVTELLREDASSSDSPVAGVRVQDLETGDTVDVRAAVVVNATGAWADRFGRPPPDRLRIHPQRGSHLVLDANRFPAPAAIFLRHPEDRRRLFVYPWAGRTVVGTTDIAHGADLDLAARISRRELEYLLTAVRPLYSHRPPTPEDVISTWSGVRPIIAPGPVGSPSGASREHRVWAEAGLISCSGGKLTTFHPMAQDILRAAAPYLPSPRRAANEGGPRLFAIAAPAIEEFAGLASHRAARLLGRYGAATREFVNQADAADLEDIGDSGVCRAELKWSLRQEAVVHLDDLLLRRSRFGLLLPRGGEHWLDELESLCGETSGWDRTQWSFERERYLDLVARNYSVPDR